MGKTPTWKKALLLAIDALEDVRRRNYAAGNSEEAQGFEFGQRARKKYLEYTSAIDELKKMLEE